jgi:hypothetical protein
MRKAILNFIDFKKINPLVVLFSMVIMMTFLNSCEKEDKEKDQIYKGPEVSMGNGKANSFFKVGHKGTPVEIGFEMTREAFDGLPQNPSDFANSTFLLLLHQKAIDLTPFDHLVLNWGPQGHPPIGVFNVPHIDFHFYTISVAEQTSIPPYTPATAAKFDFLPLPGFMPASYVADPGGVPGMGKHWGDPNSPRPFSHTMTYGSYNGGLNFVEPMVTMPILLGGTTIKTPYAQPLYFAKSGKWYPTVYNIYMDNKTHHHFVTLSDFVKR